MGEIHNNHVYYGNTSVLTDDQLSFTNTSGERNTKTFQGTQEEMESLYVQYTNNGSTCTLTKGNPAKLEVDVIGEDPEYTWEILAEAQSIKLSNHEESSVSAVDAYLIDNWDNEATSSLIVKFPAFDGPDVNAAKETWLLSIRGMTERTVFIPVLRSSYVVSSQYDLPDSLANIDYVYSTDAMINAEAIPSSLWNALPDSYGPIGVDEDVGPDTVTLYYNNGWLKNYPQITHTGWGKIQVVQEYRYGRYAQTVYGAMI